MSERLSMLDTMFLDLEQADEAAHMHIGAALVFDALPGGTTPDLARLREYVHGRIGRVPRFEQQLSAPRAGPLTWLTWEPASGFDLDGHVHHVTLPRPGDDATLHAWLGDFWSHRLDRHRPLWEMTLVDGLDGGRWALATKTHHCLVDGVGSLDIANLLLDADPDSPAHPPPPPAARDFDAGPNGNGRFWLSPGLVVRGARVAVGAALHPRASLDRLGAAIELIVREQVIAAPRTSLNGEMSATRRYAVVRVRLADVMAARTALGGTVNDVVLAVCAGGLRRLLLSRGDPLPAGLRAQVPVNLRGDDREHALGNELTSLFVELPLDEPDPIERHRRVRDKAAQLKAGSQKAGGSTIVTLADMGPPLAGALLAQSMFGGPRMFNLTITNIPGPQRRLYALGAPLVQVLPLVPLFAGHSVGIAVVTYAGEMVFGLNADRLGVADIDVLAEGIERSLGELCPSGDVGRA